MKEAEVTRQEVAREQDAATPSQPAVAEGSGDPTLLEVLLSGQAEPAPSQRVDGVVIGKILAVDEAGAARVSFAGAPADGLCARALAPFSAGDIGREVAVMFEAGDPGRPVVMGRLLAAAGGERLVALSDGERVEIAADREIVG